MATERRGLLVFASVGIVVLGGTVLLGLALRTPRPKNAKFYEQMFSLFRIFPNVDTENTPKPQWSLGSMAPVADVELPLDTGCVTRLPRGFVAQSLGAASDAFTRWNITDSAGRLVFFAKNDATLGNYLRTQLDSRELPRWNLAAADFHQQMPNDWEIIRAAVNTQPKSVSIRQVMRERRDALTRAALLTIKATELAVGKPTRHVQFTAERTKGFYLETLAIETDTPGSRPADAIFFEPDTGALVGELHIVIPPNADETEVDLCLKSVIAHWRRSTGATATSVPTRE